MTAYLMGLSARFYIAIWLEYISYGEKILNCMKYKIFVFSSKILCAFLVILYNVEGGGGEMCAPYMSRTL